MARKTRKVDEWLDAKCADNIRICVIPKKMYLEFPTLELINEVRDRPALWMKSFEHKGFNCTKSEYKIRVWREVGRKFYQQQLGPMPDEEHVHIIGQELAKKWCTIRDLVGQRSRHHRNTDKFRKLKFESELRFLANDIHSRSKTLLPCIKRWKTAGVVGKIAGCIHSAVEQHEEEVNSTEEKVLENLDFPELQLKSNSASSGLWDTPITLSTTSTSTSLSPQILTLPVQQNHSAAHVAILRSMSDRIFELMCSECSEADAPNVYSQIITLLTNFNHPN